MTLAPTFPPADDDREHLGRPRRPRAPSSRAPRWPSSPARSPRTRGPRRPRRAPGPGCGPRRVATSYFCVATWAITRLVLSPSVAAMSTSASSTPASSRTLASIPWPITSGWRQSGPSASELLLVQLDHDDLPPLVGQSAREGRRPPARIRSTIAFMSTIMRSNASSEDALGIGDDHHLAGAARKTSSTIGLKNRDWDRHRGDDPIDQVGARCVGLVDDRLAATGRGRRRRRPRRPGPRRSRAPPRRRRGRAAPRPSRLGVEGQRHRDLQHVDHAHLGPRTAWRAAGPWRAPPARSRPA